MSEEKKSARLDKTKLSLREFLKDAGICAGCAAVGGAALFSGCAGKTTTETVTVTGPGKTATVTGAGSTTTVTATGAATTKTVTVTTAGTGATTTVTATAPAAASYSMTVMDPTSDYSITKTFATRLDTLNNKTIAFHACAPTKWQPHRIFPYVQDKLMQKFTGMKFIPLTEFPQSQAGIDSATTAQSAKDKGANAVINGFAA